MSKIFEKLRHSVTRLLTAPTEELGRWARFAQFQMQLWRFCARRLKEHNANTMAAALAFRTIFALIPTLVLILLVLKAAGVLQPGDILRSVLDQAGLAQIAVTPDRAAAPTRPATAPAAREQNAQPTSAPVREPASLGTWITDLVAGLERQLTLGSLGPAGAVLLIWSALALMTTIERSLNRIFQAPRTRSLAKRILLYWSLVTFVPIALLAAGFVAGKTAQVFEDASGLSWLFSFVGWAGPIIVGVLVLSAVYIYMPNTKVRFAAAVGGAAIAVPLWLIAKEAFALYVTEIVGQSLVYGVYGALGLIPLFLVWLHLSWLLFFFGAELAHTAAHLKQLRSAEIAEDMLPAAWDLLAVAVAVAAPYVGGRGSVSLAEISDKVNLPEELAHRLIECLQQQGVVCPVEATRGQAYVLARPADRVQVTQILEAVRPQGQDAPTDRYDPQIARSVGTVRNAAQAALATMTLADVMRVPEEN